MVQPGQRFERDFNETAASDLQILCYYGYSALYTGDPDARDASIAAACGIVAAHPVYDPVACAKNNPDHIGELHILPNRYRLERDANQGCTHGFRRGLTKNVRPRRRSVVRLRGTAPTSASASA